jgi:hypothetical protein
MNAWVQVPACNAVASSGGGGGNLFTETVTVLGTNTFASLTHNADGSIGILFVNGLAFSMPDVSFSGAIITWNGTIYAVTPGDTVFAFYSYSP